MRTPLRAAVVGVGAMGRHHARIYSDLADTNLVGIADPNQENADFVAQRYGVPAYADHRDLLSATEPQLVSVAVPTSMHLAVGRDAAAAGAGLLVEKPIAASVAEGQALIAAAREAGVVITVGHIERFNPAVRELKSRLDQGELGRVFEIRARRMGPFPARVRDVGVVVDLAAHDLDIMRWMIGSPVARVFAETTRRVHTEHEDLLSGLLRFENGEIGVLNVNWLTPTKVRELSVTGERGMFLVNYLTQDLEFYENLYADSHWESYGVLQSVGEGNMTRLRIAKYEPLSAEIEAFVSAVRDGADPGVSGEDGVAALALAIDVVESGRSGEVVVPRVG